MNDPSGRLGLGVMAAKYLQKKAHFARRTRNSRQFGPPFGARRRNWIGWTRIARSGSPLLPASESESEKEEVPPFSKAKAKGPGVPPRKAVVPPPPKSSDLAPSHLPQPQLWRAKPLPRQRCPARLFRTASRRDEEVVNSDPLSLPVSPLRTTGASVMFTGSCTRVSPTRTGGIAKPASSCAGAL